MGVKATAAGQKKLQEAKSAKRILKGSKYTYLDIASGANCDEKAVQRFFTRKDGVSLEMACSICQALDLDINDIIESSDIGSSSIIDWRKVCIDMFADQQAMFRTRRGLLNPDRELSVYVPLGLVKPKSKPKPSKSPDKFSDSSQGMRQYEVAEEQIEKTFEQDAFLSEIVEQSSNSVVIVGEPGAGKSTWMEKIGESLSNKLDLPLPIFISLSLLNQKSLENYLFEVWLDEALQLQKFSISGEIVKEFKKLLRTQNFCLLLDGLDEMKSEHPTRDLGDNLQGLLKNVRVFLSCRLNVWDITGKQSFPTFDVFRSLAFSDEQVQEFITQWHNQNPDQGKKLLSQLREDRASRLRDSVKNPLRLVMLCNVWEENQELPQTKADLYSRFVAFTYDWKRKEFPISEQEIENLNQALGELAKRMIDEEKALDSSFVIQVLGDQFELAKKVGWLNQVGINAGKAIYAFYHLTFAEYFAAYRIAEKSFFFSLEEPYSKKDHFFNPKFKEIFLFWMGKAEIKTKKVQEKADLLVSIYKLYTKNHKYFQYYKIAYSQKLAFAGYQELKASLNLEHLNKKKIMEIEWDWWYELAPPLYDEKTNQYQRLRDAIEPEWLIEELGIWMHQRGECRIDFRPWSHENPQNVSFDFWTKIAERQNFSFSKYKGDFQEIKKKNIFFQKDVDEILTNNEFELIHNLFLKKDLFLHSLTIQQLIFVLNKNISKLEDSINIMIQKQDLFNLKSYLSFNYVLIKIVKIYSIDLFLCNYFETYLEFLLNKSFEFFEISHSVGTLIFLLSSQKLEEPRQLINIIIRRLNLLNLEYTYQNNEKISFLKSVLETSLANLFEDISYADFLSLWNMTPQDLKCD